MNDIDRFLLCDIKTYATSYEHVVVLTVLRTETAVWLALEYVELVACKFVMLDVVVVAKCIYHGVDKSRFCATIHVKSPS